MTPLGAHGPSWHRFRGALSSRVVAGDLMNSEQAYRVPDKPMLGHFTTMRRRLPHRAGTQFGRSDLLASIRVVRSSLTSPNRPFSSDRMLPSSTTSMHSSRQRAASCTWVKGLASLTIVVSPLPAVRHTRWPALGATCRISSASCEPVITGIA